MYYTYIENNVGVIVFCGEDGSYSFFLEDMANKDYLKYIDWLQAGNSPQQFLP
jgi:hypothetical protein